MFDRIARRYDLVAQTWTFQQEVVFADRAHAPRTIDDLAGVRVAVSPGTLTFTLLGELDPSRRPVMVFPSRVTARTTRTLTSGAFTRRSCFIAFHSGRW